MNAYQLKIVVKDSKPPVWWRCLISADISFSMLSIILDEVIGIKEKGPFSFDVLRVARIWEPTSDNPLKTDLDHSAYSAAHTPLYTVFELGKNVYYRRGEQAFRIEKECTEDWLRYPVVMLLKAPRGVDGMELAERLDRRFDISRKRAKKTLTRSEIEQAAEYGRIGIGLVGPNPMNEQTFKPSCGFVFLFVGRPVSLPSALI